jgi:hypothetical protein
MGSFFSQKTFPLEAEAASETESLKGASTKVLKSPTTKKTTTKNGNKRDGRSYAEAVRAGPETGSMSALSKSGAAWKFVKAPKDKQM